MVFFLIFKLEGGRFRSGWFRYFLELDLGYFDPIRLGYLRRLKPTIADRKSVV